MKHPVTGVGFLGPATSIPSCTFVSYDAILWLQTRIEGSCNAIEVLERMRKEQLICHASGDSSKPILPGFVLYFITKQNKEAKDYVKPLGDLEAFENEWMEVEVQSPEEEGVLPTEAHVPRFLRNSVMPMKSKGPLFKNSHLEIDINQKSDRIEWGHARYHRVMKPGHAYEITAQWVTASGPIVYELINGWMRKATQYSCFHLVSIPADPLAEPFTEKSDPLRGPIFVRLDIECLKQNRDFIFEDFEDKDSWQLRMLMFQEEILARFGFMPCAVETKTGSNQTSLDSQYVHCSGNMFILIPSITNGLRCRKHLISESDKTNPTRKTMFGHRYISEAHSFPNNHESFITRHVSGKNKEECDNVWATGFLWSWNHMIANKKWKSLVINNSQDGEIIQLRMLRDFKSFCANQNNRLVNFWDECWALKKRPTEETETE